MTSNQKPPKQENFDKQLIIQTETKRKQKRGIRLSRIRPRNHRVGERSFEMRAGRVLVAKHRPRPCRCCCHFWVSYYSSIFFFCVFQSVRLFLYERENWIIYINIGWDGWVGELRIGASQRERERERWLWLLRIDVSKVSDSVSSMGARKYWIRCRVSDEWWH